MSRKFKPVALPPYCGFSGPVGVVVGGAVVGGAVVGGAVVGGAVVGGVVVSAGPQPASTRAVTATKTIGIHTILFISYLLIFAELVSSFSVNSSGKQDWSIQELQDCNS
jgi:hypothetical protein